MIDLHVVIGDYDQKYVQKLASYLMNYKNHHFFIKAFTEIPHLENHLQNNPTDILLLTEEFYLALEAVPRMAILLVDHVIDSSLKLLPTINKYQSCEKLIQDMVTYYTGKSCKELAGSIGMGQVKLWGVYSPSGGSGKTTLAIALAQEFASRGEKTLFMSLEEVASYGRVFDLDGQTSISDLLYYAKKRSDNLLMKLEGIQRVEQTTKLKFLPPPVFVEDMITYEDEDWVYLMEQLLRSTDFENIVVDFTSAMSIRNRWMIKMCKKVLVLTNLSYIQNVKVEAFLQAYQDHQNILLAANLTKPIVEEAITTLRDLPIRINFPFSQELYRNNGSKVTLNNDNNFSEAVKSLVEVLSSD